MKETIFDLVDDDIPEGKEGYFEIARRAPEPKDNSFLNSVADYAKTALKGTVEGVSHLGKIMGPLTQHPRQDLKGLQQQVAFPEDEFEQQTENLNKLLPTEDDFGQRALRRGLNQAPTALAFPGSTIATLPRAMAAGFLGEGAKDLGAPEWAQTAAELTAYIGPDITKKLLEKGSNKELIEFAKKKGMTDEQITPLIQSEFKQKWLSRLSPKRGSTQKALKDTKQGLDEAYGSLQNGTHATSEISEKANGDLINQLFEQLNHMPREVRGKIESDLMDLLNNKITGKSLMNFFKDVNSHLSGNTKQLSLLKKPIKEALSTISPELGKDFDMVNQLYTKYFPIASKLKPNLTSDIISAAEVLGIGGAIHFGQYSTMVTILGEQVAKKVAQQMLINPRFQQLSQKMTIALNQNKFSLANKITDDLRKEIRKISPEAADKIENISEEDWEQLFNKK
jgi:hypothetical protein